jgi:hypothetical protein
VIEFRNRRTGALQRAAILATVPGDGLTLWLVTAFPLPNVDRTRRFGDRVEPAAATPVWITSRDWEAV